MASRLSCQVERIQSQADVRPDLTLDLTWSHDDGAERPHYRLAPYTLQHRDCDLVRLTTYTFYDSCPGRRNYSKQTIIFPSLGLVVCTCRERSEVGPPNQVRERMTRLRCHRGAL